MVTSLIFRHLNASAVLPHVLSSWTVSILNIISFAISKLRSMMRVSRMINHFINVGNVG